MRRQESYQGPMNKGKRLLEGKGQGKVQVQILLVLVSYGMILVLGIQIATATATATDTNTNTNTNTNTPNNVATVTADNEYSKTQLVSNQYQYYNLQSQQIQRQLQRRQQRQRQRNKVDRFLININSTTTSIADFESSTATATTSKSTTDHTTTENAINYSSSSTTSAETTDTNKEEGDTKTEEEGEEEEEETEPLRYCLFPSFTLFLGVVSFWIITRYASFLPYTGIMFILGTLISIFASVFTSYHDHLDDTIRAWIQFHGDVLLLVFLPGLIYKDSMGQNVYLFVLALGQCFLFAFPMVLVGTYLTAYFAYYVFPYNWSMNLCMTFGAILSATDPVAVAALMDSVGAPPRLKTHINGEALLNDGSAIVFFFIFIQRFLLELNNPDYGEELDLLGGIALFCQKAIGGVAAGALFGLILLLITYKFNRHFSSEDSVVEVAATFAIAYLGYYIADAVWSTSGVIANVTSGLMTTYFGRHNFLNVQLLDNFWSLVEFILNTILFTLGGVVWGGIIVEGAKHGTFGHADWLYLLLLYVVLTCIRIVLFALLYPITVRIGLKTSIQETIFQIHGGLRGAVGIALALYLNSIVETITGDKYNEQTTKAFGMVGGIAFLTLVLNGITAGPLLKYLGLAETTVMRKTIINSYEDNYNTAMIEQFIQLLTQQRFSTVNFTIVRQFVPALQSLTREQFIDAVKCHNENTPESDYVPPHIDRVLPYLPSNSADEYKFSGRTSTYTASVFKRSALQQQQQQQQQQQDNNNNSDGSDNINSNNDHVGSLLASTPIHDEHEFLDRTKCERKRTVDQRTVYRRSTARTVQSTARSNTLMNLMMKNDTLYAIEHRLLFLSILRSAYEQQIVDGELKSNEVLAISLIQSLEIAEDLVVQGQPLQDWDNLHSMDQPLLYFTRFFRSKFWHALFTCNKDGYEKRRLRSSMPMSKALHLLRMERCLSFIAAHEYSQSALEKEFTLSDDRVLSEASKIVIAESKAQVAKAHQVLQQSLQEHELEALSSIKFCSILLHSGIGYYTNLRENGLLRDSEAEELVHHIYGRIKTVESVDISYFSSKTRESAIIDVAHDNSNNYNISSSKATVGKTVLVDDNDDDAKGSLSSSKRIKLSSQEGDKSTCTNTSNRGGTGEEDDDNENEKEELFLFTGSPRHFNEESKTEYMNDNGVNGMGV